MRKSRHMKEGCAEHAVPKWSCPNCVIVSPVTHGKRNFIRDIDAEQRKLIREMCEPNRRDRTWFDRQWAASRVVKLDRWDSTPAPDSFEWLKPQVSDQPCLRLKPIPRWNKFLKKHGLRLD